MTETLIRQLIVAVATQVIAAADELTALDRATGDGDHGLSMRRGFEAVLGQIDQIAARPVPEALKTVGNVLLMRVGGASGPLYGTLFISLGKALSQEPLQDSSDRAARPYVAAFASAVQAVKRLGKSEAGCKTMLDVLVPVQELLQAGGPGLAMRIKARAAEAAASTIPMKAMRGRASFLGERSVGHMDPGARSAQIILTALCDALA
jgi:dihydroxyacetone kinase-like protein